MIKNNVRTITAYAPATTANVSVGFDILGFATDILGDTVTLTLRDDKEIMIDSIDFTNFREESLNPLENREEPDCHSNAELPFEVDKNTASVVIKQFCETLNLSVGFSVRIKKGIPLSSGLGGSAASAVAAIIACNAFLEKPLLKEELVQYALLGEAVASGAKHADNIAPCLFGGLTLVQSLDPLRIISLPIPDVFCVLVYPNLSVNTKEARHVLKEEILLADHVKQSAQLASFIVALYEKNNALLKKSFTDFLIEPQRAAFVPGFYALKKIALDHGALGMSFSGSGPTIFALSESKSDAMKIGIAMRERLKQENILAEVWVSKISEKGARVV